MNERTIEQYVDEFSGIYLSMQEDYRKRTGRRPSEGTKSGMRGQVLDRLSSTFPEEVGAVRAYHLSIAEHAKKLGGKTRGVPPTSTLEGRAKIGSIIENKLRGRSIAMNSALHKPKRTKYENGPRGRAARYAEVAKAYGWIPKDDMAAKMFSAPLTYIQERRKAMEDQGYTFTEMENGTGWIVTAPAPPPAPPTLQELVSSLDEQDKTTLYDLLKSLRK